jgi:bacterioferritin-associated ferredoxin
MKGKILVCRCEDVTLSDVDHAIALGYADIESVKRYTGFGTGPCQGKECASVVARVIAERTGQPPASIEPFTSRQPIAPTPLAFFAGVPDELIQPGKPSDASSGAARGAGETETAGAKRTDES